MCSVFILKLLTLACWVSSIDVTQIGFIMGNPVCQVGDVGLKGNRHQESYRDVVVNITNNIGPYQQEKVQWSSSLSALIQKERLHCQAGRQLLCPGMKKSFYPLFTQTVYLLVTTASPNIFSHKTKPNQANLIVQLKYSAIHSTRNKNRMHFAIRLQAIGLHYHFRAGFTLERLIMSLYTKCLFICFPFSPPDMFLHIRVNDICLAVAS